ncbi:MAG: transposase [Thermodesulfobacteriota bacterium]|nr:transposase [Thermodesulfobacteriota bacterium]
MRNVKNPNRLYIFDPWSSISPERRQLPDAGWPGLFREHNLPSIPVSKVSRHFDPSMGRPTKELYAMLGAPILQQTFDFTDEETVRQFAFNIQWHYALREPRKIQLHRGDAKDAKKKMNAARNKRSLSREIKRHTLRPLPAAHRAACLAGASPAAVIGCLAV